jgi:hypothetical protein
MQFTKGLRHTPQQSPPPPLYKYFPLPTICQLQCSSHHLMPFFVPFPRVSSFQPQFYIFDSNFPLSFISIPPFPTPTPKHIGRYSLPTPGGGGGSAFANIWKIWLYLAIYIRSMYCICSFRTERTRETCRAEVCWVWCRRMDANCQRQSALPGPPIEIAPAPRQ